MTEENKGLSKAVRTALFIGGAGLIVAGLITIEYMLLTGLVWVSETLGMWHMLWAVPVVGITMFGSYFGAFQVVNRLYEWQQTLEDQIQPVASVAS